jgi:hypothetical protein
MTSMFGRRVRTSQPQQAPQIDWSNPITAGLSFAYVCANEAMGYGEDGRSVIQYQRSDGTVVGKQVNTQSGTGVQPLLSNNYAFTTINPSINTSNYSLFAVATANSTSVIQNALDDDDGSSRKFQFRLANGVCGISTFNSGGSGTGFYVPTALTLTEMNRGFTFGASVTSSRVTVFQNSQRFSAAASGVVAPNNNFWVGARKGGNQVWLTGGIMLVAAWNRTLTDAEQLSLADNPWQLFMPGLRRVFVPGVQVSTQRALIMIGGQVQQIVDALVGSNQKPLVMYQGYIRERTTIEGTPLILENGRLRTLNPNEALLI